MLFQPNSDLLRFYSRNATLGASDRYRAANLAEQYYLGCQYDDRKAWGDKSVPLRQRKPLVQIPLFADAINTLDRFVWGGTRFPKAVVGATRPDDDDESADEVGPRLDKQQAQTLTRFVEAMVKSGRLNRTIREASRNALITTSTAIILGTRGGFLFAACEAGKHCTPTWDPENPRRLASLEVCYQYQREDANAAAGYTRRWYWYRRVIDAESDTVYVEVPVVAGQQPEWKVDTAKSVKHALGFCPVVWVRTLPDSADAIDGRPVIDPQLYPLIDDVNYTVSQRSRSVQYGGDPQLVRKGLPTGDREAIQKAPGMAWDIPAEADAKFLEIQGSGAEQLSKHLADMTQHFRAAVGVVKADPEKTKGNITGVVLEYLHAPMIALAGDLREDFGTEAYCSLLNLALRLCCVVVERGEDVWVQGVGAASKLLRKAQLAGAWLDVPITLKWAPWFSPTVQDEQLVVAAANQAVQGGLISKLTATRKLQDVYAIEDAEAERDAIEQDKANAPDYGGLLAMPLPDEPPAKKQKQAADADADADADATSVAKPPKKPKPPRRRPGKG